MRLSAVLLMGFVAFGGCSTATEAIPGADGGAAAVWAADSAGFSLRVSGGLQGLDHRFAYDGGTRTLTFDCARFCYVNGSYINNAPTKTVVLTSAQAGELGLKLSELLLTVDAECIVDAYSFALDIAQADGGVARYTDNVSCDQLTGPSLEHAGLESLYSLLQTFVQ